MKNSPDLKNISLKSIKSNPLKTPIDSKSIPKKQINFRNRTNQEIKIEVNFHMLSQMMQCAQ